MLGNLLNDLSDFLTFNRAWLPNLLTLSVYAVASFIALKGGSDWIILVVVYLVISTVLSLLGISSVFNIVDQLINLILDKINPFSWF